MNGKTPSSKAVISKFEKKANDIQTDLKNQFQQLANFINNKYESTTGQFYFKLDLLNKEIEEIKTAVIQLGHEMRKGFDYMETELKVLKANFKEEKS